jgi:Leucine-rich repeat (LRR) protein
VNTNSLRSDKKQLNLANSNLKEIPAYVTKLQLLEILFLNNNEAISNVDDNFLTYYCVKIVGRIAC